MRQIAARALVLSLVAGAAAAQGSPTLAEVGPSRVSVSDFRMLLGAIREASGVAATLETLTPTGRERLLNALIEKQLYALGARDEGLDREPDVRFWIDQAVNEVLAKKYLETKARGIDTSEPALEAFYHAHRAEFVSISKVKVRHVLLASRAEAEAVIAIARSGQPFIDVVKARTVDEQTRESGGDLGWIARGVMVKSFEDLVFSLGPGEIGGPVETSSGFHVVQVDDVEAPAVPPFASIKDGVKVRKIAAGVAALKTDLAARHPVTVQKEALASLGR